MCRRASIAGVACAALLAACQDQPLEPAPAAPAPGEAREVGELHVGYVLVDGKVLEVSYEVRDGRAVFQGDINLGPAESIARTPEELRGGSRGGPDGPRFGSVINSSSRRWPNGVVPYVIEWDVPNQWRVTDAIAHIEAATPGVDFVPRTSQSNYVAVRRTSDPAICGESEIGRTGGAQILLLNDNASLCGTRTMIHEFGHALGLWHEQSRCDRDNYVEILWDNVRPEEKYRRQFNTHCVDGMDLYEYDESSIMHYGPYAFGRQVNGVTLQTIRSRRGLDYLMGQSSGLRTMDAYTINAMYIPPVTTSVSYPGGTPTVTWNAVGGASYYQVVEVQVYRVDDYNGTREEVSEHPQGTTTGTSWSDPYATYTGYYSCSGQSGWTTWSYEYYYAVRTYYPNGNSRRSSLAPKETLGSPSC